MPPDDDPRVYGSPSDVFGCFALIMLFAAVAIVFYACIRHVNWASKREPERETVTVSTKDGRFYTVIDRETGLKHRVVVIDRGPLLLSSEPHHE